MQRATAALSRELELAAFPQHGKGDVLFERISKEAIHRVQSMRQEPEFMRLDGGTGTLIKALVAALPRERLDLGSVVTDITLMSEGVVLAMRGAGAPFELLTADPLTATRADRTDGAHLVPSRTPWVTGVWSDHLALGGSETSASEPGYLAGAVDAAERAVAEIRTRFVDAKAIMGR
ncbi:MAG TPA: hypothetical protein VJ762_03840 [Sphingobium sp.]|nr:hypothetical protein [Sphingobium sp.]